MMRIFKWVIWIAFVGYVLTTLQEAGKTDAANNARRFPIDAARMTVAIAAIPQKPDWRGIAITELKPNSVTTTLTFRNIVNQDRAEADSRVIVRAIITEIMAQGGNPMSDSDFIYVWVQQDGLRGETGAPLFRVFGATTYNYNKDLIEYKPYKP
jgi:hypothetical protein